MSWLLAVQPDPVQAKVLREALRARASIDVVVAESIEHALSWVDQRIPDVILLPTLLPPAEEDYLVAYLGTIPGAGHVQIIWVPRLVRSDAAATRPVRSIRSLFFWRRRQKPVMPIAPVCDPDVFARDVIAYLDGVSAFKNEMEEYSAFLTPNDGLERRTEPRLAKCEVPWISFVSVGDEQADLINVSSWGALVRTGSRPERHFLRRPDPHVRLGSRLILGLDSGSEVHATGRVIRCVPVTTNGRPEYEIAFSFNEAVGLHLAAEGAFGSVLSEPEDTGFEQPVAVGGGFMAQDWRSLGSTTSRTRSAH